MRLRIPHYYHQLNLPTLWEKTTVKCTVKYGKQVAWCILYVKVRCFEVRFLWNLYRLLWGVRRKATVFLYPYRTVPYRTFLLRNNRIFISAVRNGSMSTSNRPEFVSKIDEISMFDVDSTFHFSLGSNQISPQLVSDVYIGLLLLLRFDVIVRVPEAENCWSTTSSLGGRLAV